MFPAAPPASPVQLLPTPSTVASDGALALLLRVGGTPLVREMTALYRSYAPARLHDARVAVAARDAAALRAAAHALKSGAAQLGLSALATACRAVEIGAGASPPSWPVLQSAARAVEAAYAPALDGLETATAAAEAACP